MLPSRDPMPSISVVIPSFNRVRWLTRVLPTYWASPDVREIVVVDDASTPPLEEVLGDFVLEAPCRVTFLRNEPQRGLAGSRNRGLAAAAEDLVFIGEDDVLLPPGFFEEVVATRSELGVDFVAGDIALMQHEDETFEEARARIPVADDDGVDGRYGFRHQKTLRARRRVARLTTALMLGPRDVFCQVRFSENLYHGPTYAFEDYDFQVRLLSLGYRLGVSPGALSLHAPRLSSDRSGCRQNVRLTAEVGSAVRNYIVYLWRNRHTLRKWRVATLKPHHILLGIGWVGHERLKLWVASNHPRMLPFIASRPV